MFYCNGPSLLRSGKPNCLIYLKMKSTEWQIFSVSFVCGLCEERDNALRCSPFVRFFSYCKPWYLCFAVQHEKVKPTSIILWTSGYGRCDNSSKASLSWPCKFYKHVTSSEICSVYLSRKGPSCYYILGTRLIRNQINLLRVISFGFNFGLFEILLKAWSNFQWQESQFVIGPACGLHGNG